jgi:LysR family transcriptional regulator, hydrogen peroxide-inducible genes activator
MHGLHDGALDGPILALEAGIGDCEQAVVGRDTFVLAAAPHNPLVKSSRAAKLTELNGAAVLLLDEGRCVREQALRLPAFAAPTPLRRVCTCVSGA